MNKKISELTETEEINDVDLMMIVQNNENKKITKENFLKDTKQHQYHLETTSELADNSQIELPAYYKVGFDVLEVYFEGQLLKKDEHYTEVGETGSLSNKIQIKQWGDTIDSGSSFDFVIQGTFEAPTTTETSGEGETV